MEKNAKGLLTMIGDGSVFEGTIMVPHSIRIDGVFRGKSIEAAEVLTIGNTGAVEAETISAKSAVIWGKVVGNLTVEDRIELEANASLIGNIKTRDLIINEGAVFQGNCFMQNTKAQST